MKYKHFRKGLGTRVEEKEMKFWNCCQRVSSSIST